MQDMAGGRAREAATSSLGAADSSSVASTLVTSSQFPSTQSYWDSDFETEPDPPDWRHTINQEELASLNPREKQRQDVINGESNSQFQFTNPNPIEKFFSSFARVGALPRPRHLTRSAGVGTAAFLTNFTIIVICILLGKTRQIMTGVILSKNVLLSFDKFSLTQCEFQTIVKFVKTTFFGGQTFTPPQS